MGGDHEMDLSSWFTNQLNAGAEGFIWAAYARHEREQKE
jgi:hypothetical protein